MDRAKVFVPGKFRLTNKMLSDLRAAGVYEGRAKEMGRRPAPGHDLFAAETEAIKLASAAAWRRWERDANAAVGQTLPSPLAVRFFVTAHRRHDPDAWFLLAKPAIDGMAAALWSSDRVHVYDVAGRVAQRLGDCYLGGSVVDANVPGFFMVVYSGDEP